MADWEWKRVVSQGSSVTLWVDGAYRESSGCKAWRLAFRHGEASMTGHLESARQIQIQFRTPGPRRMCPAVPFPSHLVGPAWCSCQQVSGTNDEGSWAAQNFLI